MKRSVLQEFCLRGNNSAFSKPVILVSGDDYVGIVATDKRILVIDDDHGDSIEGLSTCPLVGVAAIEQVYNELPREIKHAHRFIDLTIPDAIPCPKCIQGFKDTSHTCKDCDGYGEKVQPCRFDSERDVIDARYLRKVGKFLPNVRICGTSWNDYFSFTFDGGRGLIMRINDKSGSLDLPELVSEL